MFAALMIGRILLSLDVRLAEDTAVDAAVQHDRWKSERTVPVAESGGVVQHSALPKCRK
jgi:hypothetical protein